MDEATDKRGFPSIAMQRSRPTRILSRPPTLIDRLRRVRGKLRKIVVGVSLLGCVFIAAIWIRSRSHYDAFALESPLTGTPRIQLIFLVCEGRLVLARAHDTFEFGKPSVDMRLPNDHWRFAHRSDERLSEAILNVAREENRVNAIKQGWLDCVEHNARGSPTKFAEQLIGSEAAENGMMAIYHHARSVETAGPLGLSWGSWGYVQKGVKFLLIPLWLIELLSASFIALPILSWARARRRVKSNHCHVCGYDLRATPERCPECGTAKVAKSA